MQYNPKTKALSIAIADADSAASYLLSAIHYMRKAGGHPVEKTDYAGPANTGEYCILNAAQRIGIDLGAARPGELDVSKHS